ncbi:DUF4097 family beta strand repeat-containing protein [Streptomyces sp. S.PB5]|uniref:DUF4097 family beta strand repeat-containing protein n=1 Tax=Streptomyces sp. S.PB5 TaxID=3020844 RepID=UPI0025B1D69B|nr:DUF4097 family beta strand repeat-containing protein [Streptomyces sp. S.PB5]MDN3026496.1 DUF4097 family beta strand repeat-containing protein [Streptomyces sp. S.PB5]
MRKPITAALAVAALATLSGCEMDEAFGNDKSNSESSYTVTDKVRALDLDTKGGHVELIVTDAESVKVTEKFSYSDDKPATSHQVEGGELRLTGGGCDTGDCSVSYRIELPAETQLRVDSGGGHITGKGLAGPARLRTEGGHVDVSFTKAPDRIYAASGGGDITVQVPGGPYAVSIDAEGGKSETAVDNDPNAKRKIEVRSDGGDVKVKYAQ